MRITIKKIQISFGKQCIINIKLEPNSERSAHGECMLRQKRRVLDYFLTADRMAERSRRRIPQQDRERLVRAFEEPDQD